MKKKLFCFIAICLTYSVCQLNAACPAKNTYFNVRFPYIACTNGLSYERLDMSKVQGFMFDVKSSSPDDTFISSHKWSGYYLLMENGRDLPCTGSCEMPCRNALNAWMHFLECYPEYLSK